MGRKILSAALLISLLMGTLWQTMTPTLQAAKTTAQWKTQKTGSARRPDRKIGAGQYLCGGCRQQVE